MSAITSSVLALALTASLLACPQTFASLEVDVGASHRVRSSAWYGSAQLHGGLALVGCGDDVTLALWPQFGVGFDAAPGFTRVYGTSTLGLLFGVNSGFSAFGYHAGYIGGVEQGRGLQGFHHVFELRPYLPFWGLEVQHDRYFGDRPGHGLRVLLVIEVMLGAALLAGG